MGIAGNGLVRNHKKGHEELYEFEHRRLGLCCHPRLGSRPVEFGIDFGTTRTVVAAADNGNHPVVGFTNEFGDVEEHIPTISACVEGQLIHGHAAAQAADQGHPYLRSCKRLLGQHGPNHRVTIGSIEVTLIELVGGFLRHVRDALCNHSNFTGRTAERPKVVVSVPANAHSSQRFTTLEAFRLAGFEVIGMMNEPSAAGIEYAHRHARSLNSLRDRVAVYDLGGGTFDAALVELGNGRHEIINSAGVQRLGGDDFDQTLLELALEQRNVALEALNLHDRFLLLQAARRAKEAIFPTTRRIVIDCADAVGHDALAGDAIVVEVGSYFERLAPLLEQSLAALGRVIASDSEEPASLKDQATTARVAGIYLVGGGSLLPIVARHLRHVFGRRVHRSPYPSAAVAMGLAIAASDQNAHQIDERLTRHLGVFREWDHGSTVSFDPIFAAGTPMPAKDESLTVERRYRACHNIGIFRFVECADIRNGQPEGDMSPHATVFFPFAEQLRQAPLESTSVERLHEPQTNYIEESYRIDSTGVVAVTISDSRDGYARSYVL